LPTWSATFRAEDHRLPTVIQDGETIAEHNWPLPDDPASQTFKTNFVHERIL